jgi:hypothetical protein
MAFIYLVFLLFSSFTDLFLDEMIVRAAWLIFITIAYGIVESDTGWFFLVPTLLMGYGLMVWKKHAVWMFCAGVFLFFSMGIMGMARMY